MHADGWPRDYSHIPEIRGRVSLCAGHRSNMGHTGHWRAHCSWSTCNTLTLQCLFVGKGRVARVCVGSVQLCKISVKPISSFFPAQNEMWIAERRVNWVILFANVFLWGTKTSERNLENTWHVRLTYILSSREGEELLKTEPYFSASSVTLHSRVYVYI